MLSFDEYCEIVDMFSTGSLFYMQEERKELSDFPSKNDLNLNPLIWYAAVNDIQEDEAYFEAIINQSDIETLNNLLPYFAEGTRIERMISDRIRLMQRYGNTESGQKRKTDSILENKFFTYLCSWIDKKGFKSDSEFYNHAGISRQAFSKMRNNKAPISREMALHMAVALELNYDEGVEFLQYAGYSFNPNSRREQIISFLMRKRQYTFQEIEEVLLVLHEKTFLDWD